MNKKVDEELTSFLVWATTKHDPFFNAIVENLARYPVDARTFVTGDDYMGLHSVYPAILDALEEMYHPTVEGLDHPLRIGTQFREVVLTGSLGSGKTYAAVLGILYAIYLLSCLRNPHALFGLDSASEIVFLFQSIRFQTGGVAYKLAREWVDGSKFFSIHFPKDQRIKNEILLPNNIVIRPVSGDLTAAIGMNIASVLLDEMSYMKHHMKSVNAEDGGIYDQAKALYSSTRTRIDSRFSKYGRHIVPMFLAGSARHEEDFIQVKIKERDEQISANGSTTINVYNKTSWEVKPWDYAGEMFRVYLGKGQVPPQIVDEEHPLYNSEHTIDVPTELRPAFTSQAISHALRDLCGIPSSEMGNFIVEVEKTKARFNRVNIFATEVCTFIGGDLPKVNGSFYKHPKVDRVWFAHLDLSRTTDSTGLALGYVDNWENNRPHIVVAGLLEVKPTQGNVIPWDAIIHAIYRLTEVIPLYGITADQVGYHFLREQLVPYGYKIGKVSDTPNSAIYHNFIDLLAEGRIEIANHPKTLKELLALNVDEKTGKVTKPASGSKDCADALVSLVSMLRSLPPVRHYPENWIKPNPPELKRNSDGSYVLLGNAIDTREKTLSIG